MPPPKILKVHSHLDFGLGVLRKSSLVCFCFPSYKANSVPQIYCSRQVVNIVLANLFMDPVGKTKCRRVSVSWTSHGVRASYDMALLHCIFSIMKF